MLFSNGSANLRQRATRRNTQMRLINYCQTIEARLRRRTRTLNMICNALPPQSPASASLPVSRDKVSVSARRWRTIVLQTSLLQRRACVRVRQTRAACKNQSGQFYDGLNIIVRKVAERRRLSNCAHVRTCTKPGAHIYRSCVCACFVALRPVRKCVTICADPRSARERAHTMNNMCQ